MRMRPYISLVIYMGALTKSHCERVFLFMKVFLRFFPDDKENITYSCDWVSVAPDYISTFAIPDDGVFPFTVRCYNHIDKEYIKIFNEVLDVEVI